MFPRSFSALAVLLASLALTPFVHAEMVIPISHEIIGAQSQYEVGPNDTADSIAAHFGEPELTLTFDNDDDPSEGSTIDIDNRHIGPLISDGVVVNIPQRMLFLMRAGHVAEAFPATVGRPDWQTPLGSFYIEARTKNPSWHVPPAIRAEMEDEGIPVAEVIAPGASNPLGKLWMGLDHGGIGIHSTNHPKSIFHYGSHGCVRLAPESAQALFDSIGSNEPVEIVYVPVSLAVLDSGEIYLESDSDPYDLGHPDIAQVREAARADGIDNRIDWAAATKALIMVEGIARRVDFKRNIEEARNHP
jgi:L,D-transpeptidase ErfK/SrfK